MTISLPGNENRPALRLASSALAAAWPWLCSSARRSAPRTNPVLAKVNGAEIHQSDVDLAEEELGRASRRWTRRPSRRTCCPS